MKKTIVYTLEDPRNNSIRYIGITSSILSTRLSHHCTVLKGYNYKINWIKKLKKLNLKPIIKELDVCDSFEEALYFERYWIKQFKCWGFTLVNSTEGGEGALGYKHTQASMKKMKELSAKRPKKPKIVRMTKVEKYVHLSQKLSKPLLEYNSNGDFIKEWKSQLEASKYYKIRPTGIGHALRDLNRMCNNSFWRRKDDANIELKIDVNPYIGNKNTLYVLNVLTNELQVFKSNMDAFKVIGRPSDPSKYINKINLFKKQFKLYSDACDLYKQ
jgi:hypothetical protein